MVCIFCILKAHTSFLPLQRIFQNCFLKEKGNYTQRTIKGKAAKTSKLCLILILCIRMMTKYKLHESKDMLCLVLLSISQTDHSSWYTAGATYINIYLKED